MILTYDVRMGAAVAIVIYDHNVWGSYLGIVRDHHIYVQQTCTVEYAPCAHAYTAGTFLCEVVPTDYD